ncbi:pancreatic triacylglycerol lipase-like [Topomyia yanbarensis]|uniref:pancreatic triacylglycerol lipase-like n=1 Tax=Topomyia yanbarensis TaxID=2498891 RepID=UPI00273BBB46|nr:pancreatic triacylglycerol lipase-like [Topomyia yanbarensis]XP_058840115.1 pancreatic triacylglycerol lipase-like [Topomyia yanbarensis]
MKFTIAVLLLMALRARSTPVEPRHSLVSDANGNLHLVNPNPYTVIDAELEPFFNAETDIVFRLFTRSNPNNGQVLFWNDPASVQNSNFNPAHPTRFTIHGWNGDGTSGLNSNIRNNYFAVGDFNVISVDWGAGAQTINYISARNRVLAVGEIVSRMINTLVSASGASRNSVSVIGHSLGAHAAGNAGKFQGGQIQSVIGLDPAGPLFSLGQSDIMALSDAQYVEAIFSNAGTLGFNLPLGNANFFPNGGRTQPGCGIDLTGNCAHSRAHELFAESISSTVGFRATRCVSHDEVLAGGCTSSGPDAMMGGEPSNHGRGVDGIFRMNTNSGAPFAQG